MEGRAAWSLHSSVGSEEGRCGLSHSILQAPTLLPCTQVENEELRHLLWSSVVFYQSPGLEVTACVLLSTKAVYFVLHDGLRRYFSEPLQGRHSGLQGQDKSRLWTWGAALCSESLI